jgi:hypothetical protein
VAQPSSKGGRLAHQVRLKMFRVSLAGPSRSMRQSCVQRKLI